MSHLSISQAADEFGVPPRIISDLFWQRVLDRNRCPTISGRRVIPRDYLETIREVLVAKGKLPKAESVAS